MTEIRQHRPLPRTPTLVPFYSLADAPGLSVTQGGTLYLPYCAVVPGPEHEITHLFMCWFKLRSEYRNLHFLRINQLRNIFCIKLM